VQVILGQIKSPAEVTHTAKALIFAEKKGTFYFQIVYRFSDKELITIFGGARAKLGVKSTRCNENSFVYEM
jgi:hypothetical protein